MPIQNRLLKAVSAAMFSFVATTLVCSESTTAARAADASPEQVALTRMLSEESADVRGYFDLLIYVNKTEGNPLSQRMFVFERDGNGGFRLFRNWAVSTGREGHRSPAGFYTLDAARMYDETHRSHKYGDPMPWAVFVDASRDSRAAGIAIHGTDEPMKLGTPASHGCVRLETSNAHDLQVRIRATAISAIPVLAYEPSSAIHDVPVHAGTGGMITKRGYRVLVMIDDKPLATLVM